MVLLSYFLRDYFFMDRYYILEEQLNILNWSFW